jgi:hypothetical protein
MRMTMNTPLRSSLDFSNLPSERGPTRSPAERELNRLAEDAVRYPVTDSGRLHWDKKRQQAADVRATLETLTSADAQHVAFDRMFLFDWEHPEPATRTVHTFGRG